MKKYIPLAVLAVFLMAPQAEARSGGGGFLSGLFDKKTKKRASKRFKRSRKHLAKNTRSYSKLGHKTTKRASKKFRKRIKDWSKKI